MTSNKLKLWNAHDSWDAAERSWDAGKDAAKKTTPLKTLKKMPSMQGITKETARFLKWKSVFWMFSKDTRGKIAHHFFKHPIKYTLSFIHSLFKKKLYIRDDDFFLYGIKNTKEFEELLQEDNSLLVVGFSYCHKPFECPSGRFTSECIHDPDHPVCRQCFIGKCSNALPEERTIPLYIPTVHYISENLLELQEKHKGKTIIFLITACELSLEMFGQFGKMAGIRGIGVRLDGRICNTMKAFELSEQGIKPGLTVVLNKTQDRILELIRRRRSSNW